jgi:Leucine Rich repeat
LRKFDVNDSKFRHYKLRDNFAEIISNGLKVMPKIDSVELRNNALSPKGAKFIFPVLTPNLKILDLSLNKLGEAGALMLVEHFERGIFLIEHLNLESNEIGDNATILLLNVISENLYLKKLNLSKNNISNKSCNALMKFLARPSVTLIELYLHYNKIQGDGAKSILKGLLTNSTLRVLDFSWNTIGHQDQDLGKAFQAFFLKNTTMIHCDFSYNNISYQQTTKAAEGLAKNTTILGIHWFGNQGIIRSDGYLIPKKDTGLDEIPNLAISKFRINGVKSCIGESMKHAKSVPSENCWICGAWEEKSFKYIPGRSGRIFKGPIYIHFGYDNFEAKELTQMEEGYFSITLIVPPGIIYYFFSCNNEPFIAQDGFIIRNYPPDVKVYY